MWDTHIYTNRDDNLGSGKFSSHLEQTGHTEATAVRNNVVPREKAKNFPNRRNNPDSIVLQMLNNLHMLNNQHLGLHLELHQGNILTLGTNRKQHQSYVKNVQAPNVLDQKIRIQAVIPIPIHMRSKIVKMNTYQKTQIGKQKHLKK